MTVQEAASYIEKLGFQTVIRGEIVDVILGDNGLIRFPFHPKDFGEYGEGLAKEAREFADELNPTMIYAVKVQELTGLTPSQVSDLLPEEFEEVERQGGVRLARAQTNDAIATAKLLAKRAEIAAEKPDAPVGMTPKEAATQQPAAKAEPQSVPKPAAEPKEEEPKAAESAQAAPSPAENKPAPEPVPVEVVSSPEQAAEYIRQLGFKAEVRGDLVDVILDEDGFIRFPFHPKDFGEHGEGLAKMAREFADELNPTMIYAVKVQELTGLTPSQVSDLLPEEFEEVEKKGGVRLARAQTNDAIGTAKSLAKKAAAAADKNKSDK